MNFTITSFVLGDFLTNTYLLVWDKEALLVDPAVPSERVYRSIQEQSLDVRAIVNTHGHIDHIGGNTFFKERFPEAQLLVHENDLRYLDTPALNLSAEVSAPFLSPIPDGVLRGKEGVVITMGEKTIRFILTSGHTPGSTCLYCPEEEWLLSGDTLFAGSVGRVDLPGGSFVDLVASLGELFERFPDSTIVYPGHGPSTTMGREREGNFYYLEYVASRS